MKFGKEEAGAMMKRLNARIREVVQAIAAREPRARFQSMLAGEDGIRLVFEARYSVHIQADGNMKTMVLLTDAKHAAKSKAIPVQPSDIDNILIEKFQRVLPVQDGGHA